MSKFYSKQFWVDVFDRAVTSFAQGILGSSLLDGVGILGIDLVQMLSLGGTFALISVLTSISFRGRGEEVPPVSGDLGKATATGEVIKIDSNEAHMQVDSEILVDASDENGAMLVAGSVGDLPVASAPVEGRGPKHAA